MSNARPSLPLLDSATELAGFRVYRGWMNF
jgi:hypothetical protein